MISSRSLAKPVNLQSDLPSPSASYKAIACMLPCTVYHPSLPDFPFSHSCCPGLVSQIKHQHLVLGQILFTREFRLNNYIT